MGTEKFPVDAVCLVTGDLCHPLGIGVDGDASAPNFPGGKVLKEENVRPLHVAVGLRHFVGGEVAGGGDGLVRLNELVPIAAFVRVVGRIDSVVVQDTLYGHKGDVISEVNEVVGDTLVTPRGVFVCHLQDSIPQFVRDGLWATLLLSLADTVVFVSDKFVVPPVDGFGTELVFNLAEGEFVHLRPGLCQSPLLVICQRNGLQPRPLFQDFLKYGVTEGHIVHRITLGFFYHLRRGFCNAFHECPNLVDFRLLYFRLSLGLLAHICLSLLGKFSKYGRMRTLRRLSKILPQDRCVKSFLEATITI